MALASPAGAAEDPILPSDVEGATVQAFQGSAAAAPYSYCLDIPQVLIGQKICGGFLESTATATSDPQGFALAGLAPVPKLSSVPLLVPNRVPVLDIPIPPEITAAIAGLDYQNLPSQCQAAYPPVTPADSDRTCGGPTNGDSGVGAVISNANGRAQTVGDENPLSTRSRAESRISDVKAPGLQGTSKALYSLADIGLSIDGIPTAVADAQTQEVSILGGVLRVGGIRSRTVVSTDGTTAGTKVTSDFSYGEASLGGIPINITSKGIELAGSNVPNPTANALTSQLNQIVASLPGFEIKLLPAPKPVVTGTLVQAQSAGISITIDSSLPGSLTAGTPLEGRIEQIIGRSQAQMSALPIEGTAPETPPVSTPGGGTGSGSGGTGAGSGSGGLDGSSGGTTDGGFPPLGPGTDSVGGSGGISLPPAIAGGNTDTSIDFGSGPVQQLASFDGPLSDDALRNIYPGFLALVLLCFGATRFRRRSTFLAPRTTSALPTA